MNAESRDWMPAPGLPGYEVSDDGRIRSLPGWVERRNKPPMWRPGRERKQPLTLDGYPTVSIRRNSYRVHQLVCSAFHGPKPFPEAVVRHMNGVRTDNRAENLRWGTVAENCRDMIEHGNCFYANKTHCPKGHPYDESNTYTRRDRPRSRDCKACRRERNRIFMRNKCRKQRESA